jgi:restriction endonuclease S subunit
VRFESTQPEYADESSLKFADWEQDSLGFAVNYNDLGDKWTVEDKTPASRAYEKMQNPQKLGDVVKSISSSKIKPEEISSAETTLNAYKKSSSLEEINILRISDLENGFVKSEIPKKVRLSKKAINKNTKKEFLEDNDIIVSNQGTIGKTAIYRKDKRKILPSPQIFIIKADTKKIHPEYLFTQLNQKLIQDKLKSSATGAYIPRLTKKDLENIVISVPSKKEQEKSLGRYMELKEARDQLKKEIMKIEKKLREIDLNG